MKKLLFILLSAATFFASAVESNFERVHLNYHVTNNTNEALRTCIIDKNVGIQRLNWFGCNVLAPNAINGNFDYDTIVYLDKTHSYYIQIVSASGTEYNKTPISPENSTGSIVIN